VGSLERRLGCLEETFASEALGAAERAMDRAVRAAPLEVLEPIYEAVNRIYGPPGSTRDTDRCDIEEMWPHLTERERQAMDALVDLAETLPEDELASEKMPVSARFR
jgi:hypothetical protein